MEAHLSAGLRGLAFPLDWQGQVHSVFDHAVNIAVQQTEAVPCLALLTLLDAPRNMGERCLVVPAFAQPLLRFCRQGSPVRAEQGRLMGTEFAVELDFRAFPVWQTSLETMPLGTPYRLAFDSLAEVSRVAGRRTHPAPWGDALYQRMDMWVMAGAPPSGLTDLLGAGPGLTPAGDDMLVGWLCGRQVLQTVGQVYDNSDEAVRHALRTVLQRFPWMTTDISRAFLQDALEGRFSRPMSRLGRIVRAVGQSPASKDRQHAILHRAVEAAARFGATSGRDGAYGLLLAMTSDFFSKR